MQAATLNAHVCICCAIFSLSVNRNTIRIRGPTQKMQSLYAASFPRGPRNITQTCAQTPRKCHTIHKLRLSSSRGVVILLAAQHGFGARLAGSHSHHHHNNDISRHNTEKKKKKKKRPSDQQRRSGYTFALANERARASEKETLWPSNGTHTFSHPKHMRVL